MTAPTHHTYTYTGQYLRCQPKDHLQAAHLSIIPTLYTHFLYKHDGIQASHIHIYRPISPMSIERPSAGVTVINYTHIIHTLPLGFGHPHAQRDTRYSPGPALDTQESHRQHSLDHTHGQDVLLQTCLFTCISYMHAVEGGSS